MILRSPDPYTDAKGRARLTTLVHLCMLLGYHQRTMVSVCVLGDGIVILLL